MTKKLRFWFHFNKPASKREGRNVLTLHWRGTCHRVHSIRCKTPTETHDRPTQPTCIVRGWAEDVTISELDGASYAYIS
jgi:hypothetical protein